MFGPKDVTKVLNEQTLPFGEAHLRVATCALAFNEMINTREELDKHLAVLLGYSEDQIKLVTVETLREQGLPV